MPDQIFISYRRDDAAYVTGHINDLLRKEFGNESVFTDVDNIALGVDFRAVLDESVSQCQVLLAVIGDNWLTVRSRDGKPRLNDPADFVRIEIESALKRNISVIPLLVSGAKMPLEEDLPDSLKDLAFRNGTQIRPAPDFNLDMDRLIRNLKGYLQSLRDDAGENQENRPAADTKQVDQTEQQLSHTETELRRDTETKRSQTAGKKILVGEEESARKQVELGIGQDAPKKRRVHRLWLIAILALAGASWYYVEQNPEQIKAVLTAVQTPDTGGMENLVTSEDAADNSGEPTVDSPTGFSTATMTNGGEDSAAIPTDSTAANYGAEESAANPKVSTAANYGAEDPAADPTVSTAANYGAEDPAADPSASTAAIDGAEASPELEADSTSASTDILDEAGIEAEVNLTENAENENTAGDDLVDGEVVLTPGTQRKADVSEFLSEGVSLAAIGDHEAAIQKFDEALGLDAEAPFLYKQRGASFHALGQYAAAVSDYDQAIQLNGEDVNAYYNRGASHFALQDYAATVADYDEVIRLDPELADAYSKRADAHEAMGNFEKAAQDRSVAKVFESNRNNQR